MKLAKLTFSVLVVATAVTACNNIDFKKTSAGVPYKIFPAKTGEKIDSGNIVKFNFSVKLKDSMINSSYGKLPGYQQVAGANASVYDVEPAINEILLKAKTGDSIYISFASDSLLNHNPMMATQMPIKKGEQLIFTIKVLKVFKSRDLVQADYMKEQQDFAKRQQDEQENKLKNDPKVLAQMQKDSKLIEDYLAANHITAQKKGHGTYVEVINPGTGPKIEKGKYVTMYYTGSTLKGKVFETNVGKEAATFQMLGNTIKGFEDGLMGLGKGAKAKLFIPSMLAYGDQARSEIIGPYENLVFDVDIADVTDTLPQPKQPMMNMDSTKKHK